MNLNQVTIPSIDLSKSVPFYQKLGLKLIVNAQPHYVRFECPDGDSTFSIHLVDTMPTGNRTVIYFEVEDVDSTIERLSNNGIQIESPPTDQDWLWREAKIFDPDSNPIIIYNAGENRKNPPWKTSE